MAFARECGGVFMQKENDKFTLISPVALFIFNRPDLTRRVFEEIRRVKPKHLFVIADGARNKDEWEKCNAARDIITLVDWSCEIYKNYSREHLGCKLRVSLGLDWFFNNVESGIILEDDCIPSQSFFRFCQELLEKYKNDEHVMSINGTNTCKKWKVSAQSYHFSLYPVIWGWASWRRAWKLYDINMVLWGDPKIKNKLQKIIDDKYRYRDLADSFECVYNQKIDSWDYPWIFSCLVNGGLSVVPALNLISNIGFRVDATHTKLKRQNAALPLYDIKFPLQHNDLIVPDKEYDRLLARSFD